MLILIHHNFFLTINEILKEKNKQQKSQPQYQSKN